MKAQPADPVRVMVRVTVNPVLVEVVVKVGIYLKLTITGKMLILYNVEGWVGEGEAGHKIIYAALSQSQS